MSQTIDARNLACPQPVVLTKKALENTDEVTIIVDNYVAKDNVSKLGQIEDCSVNVERKEDSIYPTLKTQSAASIKCGPESAAGIVIFIGSLSLIAGIKLFRGALDAGLLETTESEKIARAIEALKTVLASPDHRMIVQLTEKLNAASTDFAAKRMDVQIVDALRGQSIDMVAKGKD